jgi:uncharacterized glyoxalase superfamily protein PhnB
VSELTGLAPVLLVPDVEAALDHYREHLGFDVEPYVHDGVAIYGYASRDACNLHFALCADGARPNDKVFPTMFDAYLWVDDVEALHDELVERGAELIHPPTDREYGLREIRVRDLYGYVLGIGQPLEA